LNYLFLTGDIRADLHISSARAQEPPLKFRNKSMHRLFLCSICTLNMSWSS